MLFANVSKAPLVEVLKLPPSLEPLPHCTKPACNRCINAWSNGKDLLVPCERTSANGKCTRCKKGGHSCEDVEPEFYRAHNIIDVLMKTWNKAQTNVAHKNRLIKYCTAFLETLANHKRNMKKAIKEAGGEQVWARARADSHTLNLQRFKDGLGVKGRGDPSNVVVNAEIEEYVYKHHLQGHPQLERWVWYGTGAQ